MSSLAIGKSETFGKSSGIMSLIVPPGLPPMANGSAATIFVTVTFLSSNGSNFSIVSKWSKPS